MEEETIVAVYDTVAHAELAIADLKAAGIPDSAVSRHTKETISGTEAMPVKEEGFWAKLFGGEPDRDATVYSRSVENGASVVTVKVEEEHASRVLDILESHHPVDLDERFASYGDDNTYETDAPYVPTGAPMPETGMAAMPATAMPVAAMPVPAIHGDDETIRLAEERLQVGKRLVNRGGTRIRRFVTEMPVEKQVSLHEERVTMERRPITDGQAVHDADFSEKTIEMTETAEEAVVSKEAFVTEEIRLRKEATDRVETIRDTVRKEDVEIEQIGGAVSGGAYTPKV